MSIIFSEESQEIHLFNEQISYIIKILQYGQLCNLYYGKKIDHKEDHSYLLEEAHRPLSVVFKDYDRLLCPQYNRMEYPDAGRGDFREPAYCIRQENGSRITQFRYQSHRIFSGKKKLKGLPAIYTELDEEAETLEIILTDSVISMQIVLSYTILRDYPVILRSVQFKNNGENAVYLERALSASMDLPDSNYEMIQLSGAWARERHLKKRTLQQGIQGIGSRRGTSSAEQNPFLLLKRKETTEFSGELYAFSLIYSGNHIEQVEVTTDNTARISIGIHPDTFEWKLKPNEMFQTPEAVLLYTDQGLNQMSQYFHRLFASRLVRGYWRERNRPILINNWEATGAAFTEDQILEIAACGKELGIELFVLDDGWFGKRDDDHTSLGDWYVKNFNKLPQGITGVSKKVEAMGMKFGLWFEPEMVNEDSDLFRQHPDWILCPPERSPSPCRNQYVLDYSRPEVVDYVYSLMDSILSEASISYIKWDMNRYLTECYSRGKQSEEQGKVYHQYILGVYSLYERLIQKYPKILFESCSSGGARFDPGMLYYAPQAWTSDDTDAYERVLIQYGSSYVYPMNSMGAHVSAVPNQQVGRSTPIETRGNVAIFGAFGYEMDLNELSENDKKIIREQISFVKEHRTLLQFGCFYRLKNPFEENDAAWMVVSEDKTEAIAAIYRRLGTPNSPEPRLYLTGLKEHKKYSVSSSQDRFFFGNELMNVGVVLHSNNFCVNGGDFSSALLIIKAEDS